MCTSNLLVSQTKVLFLLGIGRSLWYYRPVDADQRRAPGPAEKPCQEEKVEAVRATASRYPMWGYKQITVVCRRDGVRITNKQVYRIMRNLGLLQRPRPRKAELYQAAKLFELLPQGPNDLWQTDVTYLHIPGHGWWYAVTVIDTFSRFLMALHLTPSYAAEVNHAIGKAMAKAESIHGKLERKLFLVTDRARAAMKKLQEMMETDAGVAVAA